MATPQFDPLAEIDLVKIWRPLLMVVLAVAIALTPVLSAQACPFCSAVQQTLSEEIKGADAAAILKLVKVPPRPADSAAALPTEPMKATFEFVDLLKGKELLGGKKQIEILYFGMQPVGTLFFATGVDPKDLAWSTPTALSPRAVEYISKIVKLPDSGVEGLSFFQNFFEDADPLLASDAYDEFAKSPYADVQALKSQMNREKLLGWINDPQTSTSRRRLYLTMLGVCGQADDVAKLEEMIRREERQIRTSLDALVACYLNLKGADGLPLVEDLFLKNAKAEYVDTYATIMALRFHGQEATIIPKERLMAALRYMLDRPQLADLVIPDLARWEDWSVMDRLVELFKNAKEDSIWVRVPVINYLRACPKPEAKAAIEALAKLDPDSVKRANQFFPFAAGNKPPASAVRPDDKKKETKPSETGAELKGEKTSANKLADPDFSARAQVMAVEALAVATGQGPAAVIAAPALPIETKVAAVSRPEPLARAAIDGDELSGDARASRWMLLTYAGASTIGLSVFMYSIFRTGSRR